MTDEQVDSLENNAITDINNGYWNSAITNLLKLKKLNVFEIQNVQSFIDNIHE